MELSSGTYVKNEARASVMENMPLGSWRNTQKAPAERVSPSSDTKGKKGCGTSIWMCEEWFRADKNCTGLFGSLWGFFSIIK